MAFKEGKLPEGPPESVKHPRAQILALATSAGLTLAEECANLLPYQTFLVFTKDQESPVKDITYHPIGVIHSPFKEQEGTPIQPTYAGAARGKIVLAEPYRAALADLAGFDRVWLLYQFDRARPFAPTVTPYRDTHERGLFSTRAPARPNAIGISAVRLVSVESDGIVVEGIDVLDGSPLLDIKPYVPAFDAYPKAKAGWQDEADSGRTRADGRFAPDGRR